MYEQTGATPGGGWNAHNGGAGPGGGFRTMTPEKMESMFGNTNPFSDFFNTFFGGGFSGADT
jgi:hypothetical protein